MSARPNSDRVSLGSGFQLVWGSVVMSSLGDGVRFAALPLLATRVTSDPRLIALVLVAEQLPWLVVGPLSGVMADRFDRRRILWITDSVRAVIAVVFTLFAATGTVGIAVLAIAAFLFGSGQVVYSGAWAGIIPALVGPEGRTRANARLQAGSLITDTLLGAPGGTLLFAWAVAAPFGVNALCFGVAAVLMALLPGRYRAGETGATEDARPVRRDMAEGFRWLGKHRLLRALCLTSGVSNLVSAGLTAVLVLFAKETLQLGSTGFGLLIASFSVGGLLGAAVAPRLSLGIGRSRTLTLALAGSALAAASAGLSSSGAVAACMIAAYGIASVTWNVTAVSLRQDIVPGSLLGRVSMAYLMTVAGSSALGTTAGGLLAHAWGLRSPFLAGGAVLLFAAFVSRWTLSGTHDVTTDPPEGTVGSPDRVEHAVSDPGNART
ncbi:MFS transporter [Streptomyces tendae]|nr:MFS transporter [Streptomyces tendae]